MPSWVLNVTSYQIVLPFGLGGRMGLWFCVVGGVLLRHCRVHHVTLVINGDKSAGWE